MKRLSAIVLSLILFWVQVVVLAAPAEAGTPKRSGCCSCQTAKCCVAKSRSSESVPQPCAPVLSFQLNHYLFNSAASPARLLPSGEAGFFSAVSASPLFAAHVPLFMRDCALLI